MIAIDNGYYAAEGLSVNYMPGGPDVIPEAALLTGKADISLTNLTGSVKAWEKGAALKIIGTQYQKSPVGVISLAQSNIKEPKDLAGKTVACPPLSIATFQAMLKLAGVPKEKVRVVPFTFDPTPLAKGDVDAAVDFVTELPFSAGAEEREEEQLFSFLGCRIAAVHRSGDGDGGHAENKARTTGEIFAGKPQRMGGEQRQS